MVLRYMQAIFFAALFVVVLLGVTDGYKSHCDGFHCGNDRCIPQHYICNGKNDCGDQSDERYCGPCKFRDFRCFNGKCIPRSYFCDYDDDCGDNSDEAYCDISNTNKHCPFENDVSWLICANFKRCYPRNFKCDGHVACIDSSDETSCEIEKNFQAMTVSLSHEIKSISGVEEAKRNLTRYFLNTRRSTNSIFKWGPNIMKTAAALFFADRQFFFQGNNTGEEIIYELSLQLMSKFASKENVSSFDLTRFIEALTVACINPRDFFGQDLVVKLRKQKNDQKITNPYTILTLCNANDSLTEENIIYLKKLFYAQGPIFSEVRKERTTWADVQAFVIMALTCISKRPNMDVDKTIINEMVGEMVRGQHRNGSIGKLYTTALVVQALLATGSYRSDFDLKAAMKYVLQEVKDNYKDLKDYEFYYIMPILSTMSLLNISSDHCVNPIKTDFEVIMKLPEKPKDYIYVIISVYTGEDKNTLRSWNVKSHSDNNLFEVLNGLFRQDRRYKMQHRYFNGKPHIFSLANFQDNTETNMFWFIYTNPFTLISNSKLIEKSLVDIQVKEVEELILWYRSEREINSKERDRE